MEYDFNDYQDIGEEEWVEEWPRDVKIDEAKEALRDFFDERCEEVFYVKQLEVFFEKKPFGFHWITGKAISELQEEDLLRAEQVPLGKGTSIKFVFNKKFRYFKRQIKARAAVVREYSNPIIAIACGRQAEVLFFNALMNRGFSSRGQDTNEYSGKKWTATDHDLDFIVEKDNVVYGCEVKNRLRYIEREELELKMEICKFLGIRPLFIMRASPKSYNWHIIKGGGYVVIFEAQIYPFGQQSLVKKIREVLGLPVDCPRAIPEGIIDRFVKLHNRNVS